MTNRSPAQSRKPALDERYVRYPLAKLTTPKSGFLHCMTDHWWAVTEDGDVLFFRKMFQSPQCNTNKAIAERLCPQGTTPTFVPLAFIPANPRDYV